jgi:hypothetical protein
MVDVVGVTPVLRISSYSCPASSPVSGGGA